MLFFFITLHHISLFLFFFFNDTATTEIYTLSLHDALPICRGSLFRAFQTVSQGERQASISVRRCFRGRRHLSSPTWEDRKSTRLNSSHSQISYAVFCLKKKKTNTKM